MRPIAAASALALATSAILAVPAAAQLGVGARYASPAGDFGKALDAGYGGYLKYEVNAVLIGVAAEANVTRFGGAGDADAATVAGGQVGPRLGVGLVRLGFDLGWYSKVEKVGYSPNLSVSLGPLEASAGATFFKGGRWLYLRAGLGF